MSNITRDDATGDAIRRVLSDEQLVSARGQAASTVAPTLEDDYLYGFGEEIAAE